jgi:hypothetical protein
MRAISEATSFATASRIDDGTDSETPEEVELGSEVPEIFPFAASPAAVCSSFPWL